MQKLQTEEFAKLVEQDYDVLDTRNTQDFMAGFIPAAINIPLSAIKDWAPALLAKQAPLLLVTETAQENQSLKALQDAGFDNIVGYLSGGFQAWQQAGKRTDMIIGVEPDELMMDIPFDENLIVVDVRKPMEFAEGHLKNAVNIPLSQMNDPLKVAQFNDTDNLYLHCGGDTRSTIATSVLKKHGIHNLRNVVGGWGKIKEDPKAEIVKEPNVFN